MSRIVLTSSQNNTSRVAVRRALVVSFAALLIGATGCKKKAEDAAAPAPDSAVNDAAGTEAGTADENVAEDAAEATADDAAASALPPEAAARLHGYWLSDRPATTKLFEAEAPNLLEGQLSVGVRFMVLGLRFDADGGFERRFSMLQETDQFEGRYQVLAADDDSISVALPLGNTDRESGEVRTSDMRAVFVSPDQVHFGPVPEEGDSAEAILGQTFVFTRSSEEAIDAALEEAKSQPSMEEHFAAEANK